MGSSLIWKVGWLLWQTLGCVQWQVRTSVTQGWLQCWWEGLQPCSRAFSSESTGRALQLCSLVSFTKEWEGIRKQHVIFLSDFASRVCVCVYVGDGRGGRGVWDQRKGRNDEPNMRGPTVGGWEMLGKVVIGKVMSNEWDVFQPTLSSTPVFSFQVQWEPCLWWQLCPSPLLCYFSCGSKLLFPLKSVWPLCLPCQAPSGLSVPSP